MHQVIIILETMNLFFLTSSEQKVLQSPPPHGVKEAAKHSPPTHEVEVIASVPARNSAKIK